MAAALLLAPLLCEGADAFKVRPLQTVATDDKGGELKFPEGVACNATAVVVADTGNSRLLRYTFQEDSLKGGSEIKISQLTAPLRLQVNDAGEIFALDGKQRRIVRIKADGTFSGFVEPKGMPGPQGIVPRSFKLDAAGNIWILDILGARVLQLDGAGKFQRQVEFPKEYGFVSDLAITPAGDILLLDSSTAMVFVARMGETSFAPLSKGLQEYVNFPTYLALDSRGTMVIVDQNGGSLIALGAGGTFLGRQLAMGVKSGLLNYPGQVCISGAGGLVVADRNNSRVQLFSLGR